MQSIHSRGVGRIFRSAWVLVAVLATGARADFLVASAFTDEVLRYSDNGWQRGAFVSAGSGGLNAPMAMAWGPDGDLYVAGEGPIIKKYDGKSGAYVGDAYAPPIAPGLPGESAGAVVFGLAFAPDGDLLMSIGPVVHRADLSTGSGTNILMGYDTGKLLIAHDGGVLVGSRDAGDPGAMIKRIDLTTHQVTTFAALGGLFAPFALEYGPDGMIYSQNMYSFPSDSGSTRIYRFDPDTGARLGRWANTGLTGASDLLFVEGNRLWVCSVLSGQLNLLDATTGQLISSVSGGSSWDLVHMPEPAGIATAAVILSLAVIRRHRRESDRSRRIRW
jgi:hypothetical protein